MSIAGLVMLALEGFVGSALVWAPMLLLAGDLVGEVGDRMIG